VKKGNDIHKIVEKTQKVLHIFWIYITFAPIFQT